MALGRGKCDGEHILNTINKLGYIFPMRFLSSGLFILAILSIGILSAAPVTRDGALKAECQNALTETPTPGIALSARFPDGAVLNCSVGLSDIIAATPITSKSLFRVWSISKTMTAAVLLQLVDENKVSLTDSIAQWFPNLLRANKITISQLLSHTSGIPNFTDSSLVFNQLDKPWSPEQLIAVASAMPRAFEPNEGWEYSNTNYVILGLIIEKITGKSLASELRNRLFDRLGLKSTFVWGEENIPDPTVKGYDSDLSGNFVDATSRVHPSVTWASGAIISSAEDLRQWAIALFEGQVLSQKTRQLMMTPQKLNNGRAINYGLGVEIDQTPWGIRYGKGGGPLHGFTSTMAYVPAKRGIIVTLINTANPGAGKTVSKTGWRTLLTF